MLALAAQNGLARGLLAMFAAVFAVFAVLLDDALTSRVGALAGVGHGCSSFVDFVTGGPPRF
jgi:hypothetical protein